MSDQLKILEKTKPFGAGGDKMTDSAGLRFQQKQLSLIKIYG